MAESKRKPTELKPLEGKKRGRSPRKPAPNTNGPAPAPAAPGPPAAAQGTPRLSDALPAAVRRKLEAAFAEERLESDLFGPGGEHLTMTFVLTANTKADLDFLADWFAGRYGRGRRVNRSAILRLAVRCLRSELDPARLDYYPTLPGIDGPDLPGAPDVNGGA